MEPLEVLSTKVRTPDGDYIIAYRGSNSKQNYLTPVDKYKGDPIMDSFVSTRIGVVISVLSNDPDAEDLLDFLVEYI